MCIPVFLCYVWLHHRRNPREHESWALETVVFGQPGKTPIQETTDTWHTSSPPYLLYFMARGHHSWPCLIIQQDNEWKRRGQGGHHTKHKKSISDKHVRFIESKISMYFRTQCKSKPKDNRYWRELRVPVHRFSKYLQQIIAEYSHKLKKEKAKSYNKPTERQINYTRKIPPFT